MSYTENLASIGTQYIDPHRCADQAHNACAVSSPHWLRPFSQRWLQYTEICFDNIMQMPVA